MHERSVDRGTGEIDLDRLVWDPDYRQTVKRRLNARTDETDRRNPGAPASGREFIPRPWLYYARDPFPNQGCRTFLVNFSLTAAVELE